MRSLLFVALAAASLYVLYVGVREKPAPPPAPVVHDHGPPEAPPRAAATPATRTPDVRFDTASDGYRVYREQGCQTCHGADGMGNRMGPALAEVHLHYDAESLATYLANPARAVASDERLQELEARYPRIEMPPLTGVSEEELTALLRFLLEPEGR